MNEGKKNASYLSLCCEEVEEGCWVVKGWGGRGRGVVVVAFFLEKNGGFLDFFFLTIFFEQNIRNFLSFVGRERCRKIFLCYYVILLLHRFGGISVSGRANYGKKWGKNGFRVRKNVP